jgi:hypothetical protein
MLSPKAGRSRPDTEGHGGATRCYFNARMWGHMSSTDLPGSSLLASRYRLVERLGAGGMSVVWRGFDEVLGRQVAVKVLPPSTSADPAFRRRLRAEAQAAARLSHPNITNVYDYGEATTVDGEPVPYVVMELIDGESLAAVLARTRKLPWQHAVRITAEVAAALAAAHSRGIVHRDVTPANVMLTPTGAKVVDFGISALIGENDIDPDGSLLGTPAYLAPERLEGGQVSPATDVYAVGLLIYRTLIGQLPWDVGTTTALLRAHQYTEPDPLPPVEGLPADVEALIGRCLEKRPADRPSSAELAGTLAALSAGAPSRGYVPDWADDVEDTTILPAQWPYPEVLGAVLAAAGTGAPQDADDADEAEVPAMPPVAEPADEEPEPPVAPVRNSRFAALRSGPVPPPRRDPALRPAYGNEQAPAGPPPRPAGRRPRGLVHNKTHRILVVAIGVLLLALGTYGFSFTGRPGDRNLAALPQPSVVPATGRCVVSYAVQSDKNGEFKAEVTLANRNDTAIEDWRLWFIMPGDQVMSGKGKVPLTQEDHSVTVFATAALKPQKALTLPIYGRYTNNNAAPLAFSLNNRTCETFVSAAPGAPSRQVEHLSDGGVRLGATPSTDTPLPGVSVGPGGVVTISPTTRPTTPPTSSPTPTKTPTSAPTTVTTTPTTRPPDPDPPTSEPPTSAPTTTPATTSPTTTVVAPPPLPNNCDEDGEPDCEPATGD